MPHPVAYHLEAVQRWTREAYARLLALSTLAGSDGRAPAMAFRKLVTDCLSRLSEGASLLQVLYAPSEREDPKREEILPAADIVAVGQTLRSAMREVDMVLEAMLAKGAYTPEAINSAQKLRTLLGEVAESVYELNQAYHHWRGGPSL